MLLCRICWQPSNLLHQFNEKFYRIRRMKAAKMDSKEVAANKDREANDGSACDGPDDNGDRSSGSNNNDVSFR